MCVLHLLQVLFFSFKHNSTGRPERKTATRREEGKQMLLGRITREPSTGFTLADELKKHPIPFGLLLLDCYTYLRYGIL